MMTADITEMREFITEIENLLKLHNIPAALDKCREAKLYTQVLVGGTKEHV